MVKKHEVVLPAMDPHRFLPAFSYKNLHFFGGRKDDIALEEKFDLLINLTGVKYFLPVPVFENFQNYEKLLIKFSNEIDELKSVPQLVINWDDYGIPKLPPSVWFALADDMRDFAKTTKQNLNIAIFCQGGTGRTGSALAILRNLLLEEVCDPIAVIRRTYKHDAVETYSQISYVEYVTGAESTCAPIPKYKYGSSTTTSISATSTGTTAIGPKMAALAPVKAIGETCSHTLEIIGCKGGCVEYYSKDNSKSIVQQHYGSADNATLPFDTADCPACKLGTASGLSHTAACNAAYFAKSGICPECYEDTSNNVFDHKSECSKHPHNAEYAEAWEDWRGDVIEEEEEEKETGKDRITDSIAEAIENGDYDVDNARQTYSDFVNTKSIADALVAGDYDKAKMEAKGTFVEQSINDLVRRFEGKTAEQIRECGGCLAGKFDPSFHSKACNESFFDGEDVPF